MALELKTSFLKTTDSGRLIATARYVRDGYMVLFAECTIQNEEGAVMSVTSGTFYRYEKKK